MMNKFWILIMLLISNLSCSDQKGGAKLQFGTKEINHDRIALDFIQSVEIGDYANCYALLSEEYKSDINFEDFKFRIKMLKNFADGEKFIHYNTTSIGITAEADFRKSSGENIMPEYDFTVESEASIRRKHKAIWLRFENEDSDKIRVVNYSYHYNIRENGVSNIRLNPFIMIPSYMLIVVNSDSCFIDIRGGNDESKKELSGIKNRFITKLSLEKKLKSITNNAVKTYKILFVEEKFQESSSIFDVIKNTGYEFETYKVKDAKSAIAKYKNSNSFPLN